MSKETNELPAALRSVISTLHKRLRKQMYSALSYSITEIITMGYLFRESSLLSSELAVRTGVKNQSMSQILNKMEEHKLIKRTPSANDGRKIFISLTAFGKKIVEKTRYERDEWLSGAIDSKLSEKETLLLIKAIDILNKLAKAD